jgi:hypothetical protein
MKFVFENVEVGWYSSCHVSGPVKVIIENVSSPKCFVLYSYTVLQIASVKQLLALEMLWHKSSSSCSKGVDL